MKHYLMIGLFALSFTVNPVCGQDYNADFSPEDMLPVFTADSVSDQQFPEPPVFIGFPGLSWGMSVPETEAMLDSLGIIMNPADSVRYMTVETDTLALRTRYRDEVLSELDFRGLLHPADTLSAEIKYRHFVDLFTEKYGIPNFIMATDGYPVRRRPGYYSHSWNDGKTVLQTVFYRSDGSLRILYEQIPQPVPDTRPGYREILNARF